MNKRVGNQRGGGFKDFQNKIIAAVLSTVISTFVSLLTEERVINFLKGLSDEVIDWAKKRMDDSRRLKNKCAELVGQRALERRINGLAEVIELVFGAAPPDVLATFRAGVEEVRNALAVAKALPLVKRKRLHFRIDDKIDELEVIVANAVLTANSGS